MPMDLKGPVDADGFGPNDFIAANKLRVIVCCGANVYWTVCFAGQMSIGLKCCPRGMAEAFGSKN